MVKITSKPAENDFEIRITDYLRHNPSGSTITDIANSLNASRNTISKYIKILEEKGKVKERRIGKYLLCFVTKDAILPKTEMIEFYRGFLRGLKKEFPDKEEVFKKIGRHIADYHSISLGRIIDLVRDSKSLKNAIEIFENVLPYTEIFSDPIKLVGINRDADGKTYKLIYANSVFFEESDDFIYHIYILCGYIEGLYEKLGFNYKCNVEKVEISKNKAESAIHIAFKVKE